MAQVTQLFEGILVIADSLKGVESINITLPSGKSYYGVQGWDKTVFDSEVSNLIISGESPSDIDSLRKLGQIKDFLFSSLLADAEIKSKVEDTALEPALYGRIAPSVVSSSPVISDDVGVRQDASSQPKKTGPNTVNERVARTNPLGEFASSTYQLGLYMMTPEAANRYYLTDERLISNINNESNTNDPIAKGFYLVAQSGGIDDSVGNLVGGISRIPSKDNRPLNDVFIDDLKMKTFVNTQSTETSKPISINFSFKIYEPFGASFTETLLNASTILLSNTKIRGENKIPSVLAQHYAIGVKFSGYTADGNIVLNNENTGNLFRFFPVKITSMKFRLNGQMTVYDITAESESHMTAFNVKRGTLSTDISASGITVNDIFNDPLNGIISKLNKHESDMARDRAIKTSDSSEVIIANTYKINFRNGSEFIGASKMMYDDELSYYKKFVPMASVADKDMSNVKASANNKKIDVNSKSVKFSSGTSIVAALEQVIKQSTYIKDMIGEPRENDIEIKIEKKPEVEPTEFSWFTITPSIKILGFDTVLNDHAYEIIYTVGKYVAPHIKSPYVRKLPKYPGPFKRYDYWYTGKNSEIISYDQSIDMMYYVIGVRANKNVNQNIVNISKQQGKPSSGNSQGAEKNQLEPVNSLSSSMYDMASQFNAKMTIIGDPDYIVHHAGDRQKVLISEDGTTIDPISQQNFIEIKFRQGDDYSHDNGLMKLDKLTFYREGSMAAKLDKGMTFLLLSVDSNFVGGKFTQEVSMVPHILEDSAFEYDERKESNTTTSNTTTPPQNNPLSQGGGRTTASRANWNMGPPVIPTSNTRVASKPTVPKFTSVNDDNYISKTTPPLDYESGREQIAQLPFSGRSIVLNNSTKENR